MNSSSPSPGSVNKPEDEWHAILSPEQLRILREKGTEQVANCHDSFIFLLVPLRYATVYGWSDSTIVLGAAGKVVRVEHCERVHVIAATK